MKKFDTLFITYLNQFSNHSWLLDEIIVLLDNPLIKGGVLIALIWWKWFKNDEHQYNNRKYIISTLISSIFAIVLARSLALSLPFRFRPLHEARMDFIPPYGMELTALDGWSSFPSDHAALFFSLAAGLLFVSRKTGIIALLYTTLFISFPRLYLGLHYPTDIIAGAIIGIANAMIFNIYLIRKKIIQSIVDLSYSKPDYFYPLFFLFTYQIADIFNASRNLAVTVLKIIQGIVN